MPAYNLKQLSPVPTAPELIDIVLLRTQRKTPTVIHPGYKISRIRSFYMRKVKFTQQTISERLGAIVGDFPRLDDVHPFHADLMSVLYDRDHYKLALGQLSTCKKLCESVCRDYVRLLKYGDSLYRCKSLKVAALGRMMTLLKRQKAALAYLEEVRKHIGRLPSLDPTARTLLVCGFPNVGKSSFMNKVTRAEVEVQPYAFTTKSLYVGHMDHRYLRWQVIDTPGILDHELERRNVIEMQAITALAHLPCAVLYFVDVSEQCGYTIEQQAGLYHSIRALFSDKQLVVVANKTDVRGLDELAPERRKLLDDMCAAHASNGPDSDQRAPLIEMSNVTETGITDVKNLACELLLSVRVEKRRSAQGGGRVRDKLNRLVVTQPRATHAKTLTSAVPGTQNGDESRVCIPASVLAARRAARLAAKARRAEEAADRDEAALAAAVETGARLEAVDEVRERAKASRRAAHDLVAEATRSGATAPKPATERDLMWLGGGPGVYSADTSREYLGQLRCDDWASDVVPEIMDGKNVLDFVDPDIVARLAQLDREEAETDEALAEAEALEAESALSPAEAALVKAVRDKKKLDRLKSQNKRTNASVLPRNKLRGRQMDYEGGDGGDAMDTDENEDDDDAARRARKAAVKRGRSLTRRRGDASSDVHMSIDGADEEHTTKKARLRSVSRARSGSRPPPRTDRGFKDDKQKAEATKVGRKMQKKINRLARAGEADRKTGPKLLRWRLEGKMSTGTRRSR
ncbi:hypothetical protein CTAYLR_000218 [Chrysophaeum taylorii]|uniref:OBG-type G domain-containing protein n=1 Tax=Chrysophaeum taylorii TaxID=2483200 RepID=A0AAD7UEF2_9STRA|nr:hypothetical protein CTAYLR_000218 [Chrysophaeum taylorii]